MTLSLSRIESAEKASKVSAQSPAWSRKPWPSATVARVDWRVLASPANTSGGCRASSSRARSSAAGSGQSGCWAAGNARQEPGAQGLGGVRTVGFIGTSSQKDALVRMSSEVVEPAPLPGGLDGPPVVVAAHPGDGLAGVQAVEDGQGGQGGAGAADPAAAGDLDPLPGQRPPVGLAKGVEGVATVGRDPEVRPPDPPARPGGRGALPQDQGEVGRAGRVAQPPPPHPGPAGQGDQPGLVLPAGDADVMVLVAHALPLPLVPLRAE